MSPYFGGDKRDRTADPLNAIQALSRVMWPLRVHINGQSNRANSLIRLCFLHFYYTTARQGWQAKSKEKAHRFFRSVRFLCALKL